MPTWEKSIGESSMGGTKDLLLSADTAGPEVIPVADQMEDVADMIWSLLAQFRNIEWNIPLIARLNKEGTRHAVVFVPSRLRQHVRSIAVQFIFAVPAALNNPRATCLRRFWILRKAKTSDSVLSIVGQVYYFGEELRVDGEVTYAEDVTVVGRWNDDVDSYDSAEEWADSPHDVSSLDIEWDSDGARW
jgi:hypothetical protein